MTFPIFQPGDEHKIFEYPVTNVHPYPIEVQLPQITHFKVEGHCNMSATRGGRLAPETKPKAEATPHSHLRPIVEQIAGYVDARTGGPNGTILDNHLWQALLNELSNYKGDKIVSVRKYDSNVLDISSVEISVGKYKLNVRLM
jgi:hypothetical protein